MSTIINPLSIDADDNTVMGPSGYVELSAHTHPDGGASHLELFLLEQGGDVSLSLSKDDGPNMNLTKAEWEDFKIHAEQLWAGVID